MRTPILPLPAADLARRLSGLLAPRRDGLSLTVTALELVTHDAGPGLGLRMTVKISRTDGAPNELWQVTIPVDPIDLDPSVNVDSFVITIRANLEEWWHVRKAEPRIALWGRRLA